MGASSATRPSRRRTAPRLQAVHTKDLGDGGSADTRRSLTEVTTESATVGTFAPANVEKGSIPFRDGRLESGVVANEARGPGGWRPGSSGRGGVGTGVSARRDGALMFQVRIHGRGGQGAVTAAELLSVAAFADGRCAQAFPSFGSERNGAPVESFCRIDDDQIRSREPVSEPDALIVLDVTLIHQVDLFSGLCPQGFVLVNTSRSLEELGLGSLSTRIHADRIQTCPATELALAELGRPLPNAALLGGFAAQTGQVSIGSVEAAVRQRFVGPVADGNVNAARAAYHLVELARKESVGAASD